MIIQISLFAYNLHICVAQRLVFNLMKVSHVHLKE